MTIDIEFTAHTPAQRDSSPATTSADIDDLADRVQARLAPLVQRELSRSDSRLPEQSHDERAIAGSLLDNVLADVLKERATEGKPLLERAWEWTLKRAVMAEMFGLGRLEPLLAEDGIENIDVIGSEPAWLTYDDGRVVRGPQLAPTDDALVRWLQRIASRHGRTEHAINNARPLLNMELPGGERLAAAIDVTDRPHVSIRRHRLPDADLSTLRRGGMISTAQLAFLRAAVRAGKNIIVTGRQRAGKTTLLRALCWEIPATERFATLETEFELGLHRYRDRFPAVVAFEERDGNAEHAAGRRGDVDLSRLVRHSLRMHTSRLVVGEVRGREVIPMLNALSSGGAGSLSTLHARDAGQAIHRMVLLCLEANPAWTPQFAHDMVAQTIDLIVHVDLVQDEHDLDRYVAEIVSIEPGEHGRPARTALFKPGSGDVVPGFGRRSVPTGNLPTDLQDYERAGFDRSWLTAGGDGQWTLTDRRRGDRDA